jgi:hypothetical protein
MNNTARQPNTDHYGQAVDLVVATCGGDIRRALRALV